jgi:hypothetical protein
MSISVSFSAPVIAQALIGVGALAAFTLTPPAEGRMLLVSLSGESEAEITSWTIDHGLRIVERGPIAGSLVVAGRSREIMGAAFAHGKILTAAPAAGCGAGTK